MKSLRDRPVASSLAGIHALLLIGSTVIVLSLARDVCVPLALAALVSFLLAPVVTRLERWIGRVCAVVLVVGLVAAATGAIGYLVGRQFVDLTGKLPDYQANIAAKLRSLQPSEGGALDRLTEAIESLRKGVPASDPAVAGRSGSAPPVAVQVVEPTHHLTDHAHLLVGPVIGTLATAGLVLVLVVFMLMHREDLRGRLIRLLGQGRIGLTTTAMSDAGRRVSKYLLMQLVVNIAYGVPIAIGLLAIGVPNALLWGALAAALRFIPYAGAWIAAAGPIVLSLAISDGWRMPLTTIALYIVVELVSNNVMEPWLYGVSTGVSSLALILAAVFWTWLWGPIGLVLATPLTVCLVVIGRHVPRLRFLSVMLSDEEPLTPHEELYHRLLRKDPTEATALVDEYLAAHSFASLYDDVLIPVLATAEADHGQADLDAEQRAALHQALRDILEDLGTRAASTTVDGQTPPHRQAIPCRVLTVPVRALRDELAGDMLTHVLRQYGFRADILPSQATAGDHVAAIEIAAPEIVCISVMAPSALVHARHLCAKLHARMPAQQMIVAVWGTTRSTAEAALALKPHGVESVVATVGAAVVEIGRLSEAYVTTMVEAPIPADEDERIASLEALRLTDPMLSSDPALERLVTKAARIFDTAIARCTLIDRDHQIIVAQVGLSDDHRARGRMRRSHSVCGHVIAQDEILAVPDLARDRRFALNPTLLEDSLRFYAGAPIHAPDGQPIGTLCILDPHPRAFDERDQRHLAALAEEATALLVPEARPHPANPPASSAVSTTADGAGAAEA